MWAICRRGAACTRAGPALVAEVGQLQLSWHSHLAGEDECVDTAETVAIAYAPCRFGGSRPMNEVAPLPRMPWLMPDQPGCKQPRADR